MTHAEHEARFPAPPVSYRAGMRPAGPVAAPRTGARIGVARVAVLRDLVQRLGRPVTGRELWEAMKAAGVAPKEIKDVHGAIHHGRGVMSTTVGGVRRWWVE